MDLLKQGHSNIFFYILMYKKLACCCLRVLRNSKRKKDHKTFELYWKHFLYFLQVADDSFSSHIFELSLDSEDSRLGFQSNYANNHKQMHTGNGGNTSNSSSPMSSRRDFSSSPSTPSSSSSLPLEAAFSQFAASFSTIMNDKESAASALGNF